jgi:hypothetical protein
MPLYMSPSAAPEAAAGPAGNPYAAPVVRRPSVLDAPPGTIPGMEQQSLLAPGWRGLLAALLG